MPRNAVLTIAAALSSLVLPSGSPWAVARDDIAATLTTLLKGHVYPGLNYRKETIRKVQFAPSQSILGIEFDDAEESAPITAIVPLQGIAEMKLSGGVAVFQCRQPGCILLTFEDFLPAVAKLTQNPHAKLVGLQHVELVEFGYKAENNMALGQAMGTLMRIARGR
jgi:hypothetical protein